MVTIGDGTLQVNGNTMDSASFDAFAEKYGLYHRETVGVVPEDSVAMSELVVVLDVLTKYYLPVALWLYFVLFLSPHEHPRHPAGECAYG